MAFTVPTEMPVSPRPKGTIRKTGSDTAGTSPTFAEIVSHTPENGVTFSLAKILGTWSGTDEQQIRVKLDTEVIAEYYATAYVMDWFPPGMDLVGDGTKTVVIEASAAAPAFVTGFIAGEES